MNLRKRIVNEIEKVWREIMKKITVLLERYKSIVNMFFYMLFYLMVFEWLEERKVARFHVIHTALDSKIPFCEYFVVPYFLWFFYVAIGVLYIGYRDNEEGRKLGQFLMTGMTIFLAVSILYPNVQYLRPHYFKNDNIFVDMVKALYQVDTSTNILPSIHVYNSIGVMIACGRDAFIRKHKGAKWMIWLLGISIILSTMFIKQHSVIDVTTAIILGFVVYGICYKWEIQSSRRRQTSEIPYKY